MNTPHGYDHQSIEQKWITQWSEHKLYETKNSVEGKENFYVLSEFAYPSGNLHVGHWYAFALPDMYARYKRMKGYNVLYPLGFDSFGLPAENAAIKRGLDPKAWTYDNITYMEQQLTSMGSSFDTSRMIRTSDPEYYQWTQWMITEFFKHGLMYKTTKTANYCASCKTILANEQVINGQCERCDNDVEQKSVPQWMLRIRDFADDLLEGLEHLEWDDAITSSQRQWIGKSEGAIIPFTLKVLQDDTNNEQEEHNNEEKSSSYTRRDVAKAILVNEHNEVYTLHHHNGVYDLPGGAIEEGEEPLDCLYRELCEETGYRKDDVELVYSFDKEFSLYDKKGETYGGDHFVYLLKVNKKAQPQAIAQDEQEKYEKQGFEPLARVSKEVQKRKEQGKKNTGPLFLFETYFLHAEVFTTRADTLAGVTYLALAPDHPLIEYYISASENGEEVQSYCDEHQKLSSVERQQLKEKTGVALRGVVAKNPFTKEDIPVYVASYVLADVGTGVVMGVPAHDERDNEFACRYDIPVKFVMLPSSGEVGNTPSFESFGENDFITTITNDDHNEQSYRNKQWNAFFDLLGSHDDGVLPKGKRIGTSHKGKLINAPRYNALPSDEVIQKVVSEVQGRMVSQYRIKDWGVSRQRYWGTPIPIVYDPEGKAHAIPKEHLPWTLPMDVDYTPDGTAPLARSQELQDRTEKIFGEGWTAEYDTLDTFVDSSWYFYRYLDPNNDESFVSPQALSQWMPVDHYFGGAEHTTLHLLYSRFWSRALASIGYEVPKEPYHKRSNRGLILGPDGNKMSKSKGNVIDPDNLVSHVGADVVRCYLAFIGPFNEPGNYPWDENGVVGIRRFLERVERLNKGENEVQEQSIAVNIAVKKVDEDIERLKYNTALSALMICLKTLEHHDAVDPHAYQTFLKLLAPFAPFLSEELWERNGFEGSIHRQSFPEYNEALHQEEERTLAVQINGKVRAEINLIQDEDKDDFEKRVRALDDVQKWIEGKEVKRFIYVPEKIINIVV